MRGDKMKLVIWALVMGSVPFVVTGAIILAGHFTHTTMTVNWAECATAGVAVAAVWLVTQKRRSHQTF
jgi:hypothetical protein